MLDFDLAEMYGVETKRLKEQVRRNIERFPTDFMFELEKAEWFELVAICDQLPKNIKHSSVAPFAFTEHGVTMLSGVLRSKIAVNVSLQIVRAFIAMRNVLAIAKANNTLPDLVSRIKALEEISEETLAAINDLSEDTRKEFDDIYIAMTELASKQKQNDKPRKRIGFVIPE